MMLNDAYLNKLFQISTTLPICFLPAQAGKNNIFASLGESKLGRIRPVWTFAAYPTRSLSRAHLLGTYTPIHNVYSYASWRRLGEVVGDQRSTESEGGISRDVLQPMCVQEYSYQT